MNIHHEIDLVLNKIDQFLALRNRNEKFIIILLPLTLSLYLSFQFFYPMVESGLKPIETKQRQVIENVTTYQQLLATQKGHGGDYLEQLAYSNQKLRKEIESQKDLTLYTEAKLLDFDFLRYDEFGWSNFLDTIVVKAQNERLRITQLHNQLIDNDKNISFFPRYEVDMNITGNFSRLFNFITFLHEQPDFVDIYSLQVEGGHRVNASVKMHLWGHQ